MRRPIWMIKESEFRYVRQIKFGVNGTVRQYFVKVVFFSGTKTK